MSFVIVDKEHYSNSTLPKNIVRLRSKSGMSMGANVAKRLATKPYKTARGTAFKVQIEVDVENKKIRLTPSDKGFSFSFSKYGSASICELPAVMNKLGLEKGDYISKNNSNTFVLA